MLARGVPGGARGRSRPLRPRPGAPSSSVSPPVPPVSAHLSSRPDSSENRGLEKTSLFSIFVSVLTISARPFLYLISSTSSPRASHASSLWDRGGGGTHTLTLTGPYVHAHPHAPTHTLRPMCAHTIPHVHPRPRHSPPPTCSVPTPGEPVPAGDGRLRVPSLPRVLVHQPN